MQQKPVSNNPIIHSKDQELNDLIKSELPNLEKIIVNSNQIFALQDEHSDIAFFLSAGTVQVYVNTSYGPVTLASIQAPRLIGEISSITHLPRIANLKAQTDRKKEISLCSSCNAKTWLEFTIICSKFGNSDLIKSLRSW